MTCINDGDSGYGDEIGGVSTVGVRGGESDALMAADLATNSSRGEARMVPMRHASDGIIAIGDFEYANNDDAVVVTPTISAADDLG